LIGGTLLEVDPADPRGRHNEVFVLNEPKRDPICIEIPVGLSYEEKRSAAGIR
jgi:hypothetical protein